MGLSDTCGRSLELSVVVTVVDGGATLERCLEALREQRDLKSSLEVLVPWDGESDTPESLQERFSEARWIRIPGGTRPAPGGEAERHERYDRRRSAGLAAARAPLVAILEDRGAPKPTWAAAVIAAHSGEEKVVGGAIENGVDRIANWAVYFCDFGRYGLPFSPGEAAWISDVNVSYPRELLHRFESTWAERFHETTLHWALRGAGVSLELRPEPVVEQRRDTPGLVGLIGERLAWGRLFAETRVAEESRGRSLLRLLTSPLLPPLLLFRQLRLRLGRGCHRRRWLLALPLIVLLLGAWSLGEASVYAAASFGARRRS